MLGWVHVWILFMQLLIKSVLDYCQFGCQCKVFFIFDLGIIHIYVYFLQTCLPVCAFFIYGFTYTDLHIRIYIYGFYLH
jgi:hypothetical protein